MVNSSLTSVPKHWMLMASTVGVGVGVGVGGGSTVGATFTVGVGVATILLLLPLPLWVSRPFRLVETMTMTARITATTRIRPKIICHLVLVSARSYAAVPFTVLGVGAGVLPDCVTRRVPQFGQ